MVTFLLYIFMSHLSMNDTINLFLQFFSHSKLSPTCVCYILGMENIDTAEVQKTIAIDFDGTLHDVAARKPPHRLGQPFPSADVALPYFRSIGLRIAVFCVWADSDKNVETIAKWMDYFHLPYDEVTNVKMDAVAYVDGRAVPFDTMYGGWDAIVEKFKMGALPA